MTLHSNNTHPNYRLVCGQYVLHKGDTPVQAPMDEVALALDSESGNLHKHGKPEHVNTWAAHARKSFHEAAERAENVEDQQMYREMAACIVVMQGRFSLEDLNKVLTCSGYAGQLYRKACMNQLACLDLLGRTQMPLLAR